MADVKSRVMIRVGSDTPRVHKFLLEIGPRLLGKIGPFHIKQDLVLTPEWPETFKMLQAMGHQILWDQRMNDVQNTMCAGAVALAEMRVWGFSLSSRCLVERVLGKVARLKNQSKLFLNYQGEFQSSWNDLGVDGLICDRPETFPQPRYFWSGILIALASICGRDDQFFPSDLISGGADFVSIDLWDFMGVDESIVVQIDRLNDQIEKIFQEKTLATRALDKGCDTTEGGHCFM